MKRRKEKKTVFDGDFSRSQILEYMFTSKKLRDCIQKMEPADLREDLLCEVMLVLSEQSEEKLVKMWTGGYLEFFSIRCVLNMIKSDRSTFYKKFRRSLEALPEEDRFPDAPEYEEVKPPSLTPIHWTEAKLLELLGEHGSMAAVSRHLGVSDRWVTRRIHQARHRLYCTRNAKMEIVLTVPVTIQTNLTDMAGVKSLVDSFTMDLSRRMADVYVDEDSAIVDFAKMIPEIKKTEAIISA